MRLATAALMAVLLCVPAWARHVCTISQRVSDARMQMAVAAAAAAVGEENGEPVGSTDQGLGFTIKWADAGVTSPTNAALLIANDRNSEVVELSGFDAESESITLPTLVLAELEQRNLGPNTSFRCTVVEPGPNGTDEIKASCLVASAVASANLPNFNYKDGNGDVAVTDVGNRTLVAYAKMKPNFIMRDPSNVSQQKLSEMLAEKHAYYSYTYTLPDGTLVTYDERKSGSMTSHAVNTVTLPVNLKYSGANEEMLDSVICGLIPWVTTLKGTIPVEISVTFSSFSAKYGPEYENVIGMSMSPGAVCVDGVWYPSALFNNLLDFDIDENDEDITLEMNTDMPFYYDANGSCPSSKIDFPTIMLHETAHGLGFYDSIDPNTGKFEYGTGDYPLTFDTLLWQGNTRLTAMTPANRKRAILSNALYWDGGNAKAANGGGRVKMYAPATYQPGSSVSHWDDSVSFRTFMKWHYEYPMRTIDASLVGAMKDMGWELATTLSAPQPVGATQGTYSDKVLVSWATVNGATSYSVYRATSESGGKTRIASSASSPYVDMSVAAGTHYYYFVTAVNSDGESSYSAAAEGWAGQQAILSSIGISGLASVGSGQKATYSCTAYYSDGSYKSNMSPVEWEIVNGSSYATMNGSSLTAGSVTAAKTVVLEARYGGKSATKTITITPVPASNTQITFNYNDGSDNTYSRDYPTGSPFGSFPDVSRSGYSLIGWFTAPNGGTQVTTSTIVSSAYAMLYAHWSAISVPQPDEFPTDWSYLNGQSDGVSYSGGMFTITGVGNNTVRGITFTTTESGTLFLMQKVSSEANWDFAKILLDGEEVSKISGPEGSWQAFSKSVGAGTHTWTLEYSKDSSDYFATGDDTAWFKDISFVPGPVVGTEVAFDADGGSASYNTKTYDSGESYGELPTASRSGYKFLGWYTARGSGGVKITASSMVDESITVLYAQWNGNGSASWSNDTKTKKSTATAKPKSGYVFAYWVNTADGSVASYASKITVATSVKSEYRAVFVRKADVAAPSLDVDWPFVKGGAELDNARVGVKVNDRFNVPDECRPVKFSAKGLPKGLSVNATSGAITGVPKTAGKYTVTLTVTSVANSKKKITRKIPVTIYKLPSYVTGSFIGGYDDGDTANKTTLSIVSSGKISGKVYYGNAVWTVTAANFTDEDYGLYKATLTLKKGTTTQKKTLLIEQDELGGCAYENNGLFEARQNLWAKDAIWKEWAAALSGHSLMTEDGMTTVKFGKNGTCTVTTTFGSYKCSASSVLMPTVLDYDDLNGVIYLYFAPNTKKKFKGRVIALYFE